MENKNIAYKAIFVEDGVIFLFQNVSHFSAEEVRIRSNDKDLFIELGDNIVNLTGKIIDKLLKNKTLFLYKAPEDSYAPDTTPIAFEIEQAALNKLKTAWREMKNKKTEECNRKSGNSLQEIKDFTSEGENK